MPSKKKKYNARFPAGRIKKIMQTDEEVGKVAQAVPVIISRTLELFVESLLKKTVEITNAKNARTLTPSHMKQCILSESRFDFLADLVKNIPDAVNEEDEISNPNSTPSRRRTSVETSQSNSSKPAPAGSTVAGCHSHHNHVSQQSSVSSSTLPGTSFSHQSGVAPTVQNIQYAPSHALNQSGVESPAVQNMQYAPSHALNEAPYVQISYPSSNQIQFPLGAPPSQYTSQSNNNLVLISHPPGNHLPISPAPHLNISIPQSNHHPVNTAPLSFPISIPVSSHLVGNSAPHIEISIPGSSQFPPSFPIQIPTSSQISVPSSSSTSTFNGMVPSYTPNQAYSSQNLVIDEDYDN